MNGFYRGKNLRETVPEFQNFLEEYCFDETILQNEIIQLLWSSTVRIDVKVLPTIDHQDLRFISFQRMKVLGMHG
ncbi:hypothetical protein evm_007099 [Chilo suppressalis]|nr:hypothetical protein evm_007099 [Chilo suppressalis]